MPYRIAPPAGAGRSTRRRAHHLSILLVEDDDDIREAMALFLQTEGYDVVEATNGDEALNQLRLSSGRFCMVLLDLFMPVMNGWEFRAEQMADPKIASVPVVVLSADRNARDRGTLGAVEYLVKPVDFDHLLGTIAAYC